MQVKLSGGNLRKLIIARIESVIETQQLEGATVGAFNANIIARKLGLAEKQESTLNVKGSIPVQEWIKARSKKK